MNKKQIAAAAKAPIAPAPSTPTVNSPIEPLSPPAEGPMQFSTVRDYIKQKSNLEAWINIRSGFYYCLSKERTAELRRYVKEIKACAQSQMDELINLKRTAEQELEFKLAEAVIDFTSPVSCSIQREEAKTYLMGFL